MTSETDNYHHQLRGPCPHNGYQPTNPRKTSKYRKPRKTKTRAERFWPKVDTFCGPNSCHPWTASLESNGYGQFSDINPKTGKPTMRTAHVVAWELANRRPVPEGKLVLHAHGC